MNREPVHPMAMLGTLVSSFGAALQSVGTVLLGLVLSWAALWLDIRVRRWIERDAAKEGRSRPLAPAVEPLEERNGP